MRSYPTSVPFGRGLTAVGVPPTMAVRRRRGPVLRHLRRHPLLTVLGPFLLALALVGAVAAAVDWVLTSQLFAVQELVVEILPAPTMEAVAAENGRVPATWVRAALRPFAGRNMLRLSLAEVDHHLRRHPWVAATDLRKELPARLVVRVIEKRAVALWRGEEGLQYVDPAGLVIAPFDPRAGAVDLVLIRGGRDAEDRRSAVELAAEIAAFELPWAGGLSEIEILGRDEFRITSAELPFPLLARAGAVARARQLQPLIPQILRRYGKVATVDLRFARRIIVQPSVPGRLRDGVERG